FHYAEYDGTQLVALPYGKGTMTMIVVLPKDGERLERVENALDGTWLESALARGSATLVNLSMPKFTMTLRASLRDALSRIGMPLAFDRVKADLSGMDGVTDPQRHLVLDD